MGHRTRYRKSELQDVDNSKKSRQKERDIVREGVEEEREREREKLA